MIEFEMPRLAEIVTIFVALGGCMAALVRSSKNSHSIVVSHQYLEREVKELKEEFKDLREKTETRLDDLSVKISHVHASIDILLKSNQNACIR